MPLTESIKLIIPAPDLKAIIGAFEQLFLESGYSRKIYPARR